MHVCVSIDGNYYVRQGEIRLKIEAIAVFVAARWVTYETNERGRNLVSLPALAAGRRHVRTLITAAAAAAAKDRDTHDNIRYAGNTVQRRLATDSKRVVVGRRASRSSTVLARRAVSIPTTVSQPHSRNVALAVFFFILAFFFFPLSPLLSVPGPSCRSYRNMNRNQCSRLKIVRFKTRRLV